MKTVLKWTIPVDDEWHPVGAGPVLHVASQFGKISEVQVWTEEVYETRSESITSATVIGTGHSVPDDADPLGSVVTSGGHLVWHVYRSSAPRPRSLPL